MRILSRFVKFFWILSVILYFVALFSAYFYWPQVVDVKLKKAFGYNDIYVHRETLFYYFIAALLIFNGVMFSIAKTFGKFPKAILPVSNKDFWLADDEKAGVARQVLKNWMLTFNATLNVLGAMFLGALFVINYQGEYNGSGNYMWLLPFSITVIAICILYPFIRFSIKSHLSTAYRG